MGILRTVGPTASGDVKEGADHRRSNLNGSTWSWRPLPISRRTYHLRPTAALSDANKTNSPAPPGALLKLCHGTPTTAIGFRDKPGDWIQGRSLARAAPPRFGASRAGLPLTGKASRDFPR